MFACASIPFVPVVYAVAFGGCLLVGASVYVILRRMVSRAAAIRVAYAVGVLVAAVVFPYLARAITLGKRASADCHLKQIGVGLQLYADKHAGISPPSLDDLAPFLGSRIVEVLTDPQSGQKFVYVGAGQKLGENPYVVIAYSPTDRGGRNILFGDFHTEWLTSEGFAKALERKYPGSSS